MALRIFRSVFPYGARPPARGAKAVMTPETLCYNKPACAVAQAAAPVTFNPTRYDRKFLEKIF